MNERISYVATHYSPVELPTESGLFTETIQYGFKCNKESQGLFLDIDVFYLQVKDRRDYIVLKSQSQFLIQKQKEITPNDIYVALIHSIKALKLFPQAADFGIEKNLSRIISPSKRQGYAGLKLMAEKIETDHCQSK